MQLKDLHDFRGGLNTDDNPSNLPPSDYPDALNIRTGGSDQQHGEGPAETLQGEIEILINPDSLITYYGSAIGGQFVYSGYAEVQIGTQVWMKKNWDAAYPGSKVYNDDENNRDVYGGLYTHGQIMASDFCPDGWHVPTEAEVDILIAELLGEAVAGGKLKDIGWWDAPNTGADDSSGFKAMPGGGFGMDVMYYGVAIGSDFVYDLLGSTGLLWLADEVTDVVPPVTFDDYFLPSTDNMNGLYAYLFLSGVGNFAAGKYWTSSEGVPPGTTANALNITVFAWSTNEPKGNINKVRAIRSFISTIIYNRRDTGPAGGLIFDIIDNGDGTFTYFESALSDCADSVWSNIVNILVGTTDNMEDGQANTNAIINQVGHTNSAAKLCADLIIVH